MYESMLGYACSPFERWAPNTCRFRQRQRQRRWWSVGLVVCRCALLLVVSEFDFVCRDAFWFILKVTSCARPPRSLLSSSLQACTLVRIVPGILTVCEQQPWRVCICAFNVKAFWVLERTVAWNFRCFCVCVGREVYIIHVDLPDRPEGVSLAVRVCLFVTRRGDGRSA